MAAVTLREIQGESDRSRVRPLRVRPKQDGLVATDKSLSDVDGDPALKGFAIYDEAPRGLPTPSQAPVGFAVSEVVASVASCSACSLTPSTKDTATERLR
jgi:hypothetical protein